MGLFDRIRRKETAERKMNEFFEIFSAYRPAFTSFEGGMYEMDLTRAAVHSFATHVSKLKPEVKGFQCEKLQRTMKFQPNPVQDTTKFLYRLATIFQVQNNAFIIPLTDKYGGITGYYPVLPSGAEVKSYDGRLYLVYSGLSGVRESIELEKVGIVNQFYYRDELFGETNKAMQPTLELLNTQNQGIIEGVKSSANIRFLAKLASALKSDDISKERKRFTEENLGASNNGGIILVDQKYEEVKQIESKPYTVNPLQAKMIQENVWNYFGTNEVILQNKFTSDEWNAYFEGKIEPFAIQLSLVMTNMTFTDPEKAAGSEIIFSANRLQYMSNTEKLSTITQLFDRGFLTHNEGLEILNMPGIGEEGDKRYIRMEYGVSYKSEVNHNEE